jgi:hypothetical protein
LKIKTPIIGIPKWKWKKQLVGYAKENPNICNIDIVDSCYECSRHKELLKMVDISADISSIVKSDYYIYQKTKNKHKNIMKKIEYFKSLYNSILEKGCLSIPIITDDGCRLDGSHRLSILLHLGVKRFDVNVAVYEKCFSNQKSKKIRSRIVKYRKKIYGI